MKKIRLDLGALQVETFHPQAGAPASPGTVRGHTTHHCTCEPACVYSTTCTTDPGEVECYSYAAPCPPTDWPNMTCDPTWRQDPCNC